MNKKSFLAIAFLAIQLFAFAQTSSFTYLPLQPKRGDKVTFTYNPTKTPLSAEKGIEAAAYSFNATGGVMGKDIKLVKTGNVYTGSFVVDSSARVVGLAFTANEKKDPNNNQGYIITITQKGKPVEGVYIAMQMIYTAYGKYLFGMDSQPEKSFAAVEKEWNENVANREKMIGTYINELTSFKKKEAEPIVKQLIAEYLTKGNITEGNYTAFIAYYTRLKQKVTADSITALMKAKYPNGNWQLDDLFTLARKAKEPADKEIALNNFIKAMPKNSDAAITEMHNSQINYLQSAIASAYAMSTTNRDLTKFKSVAKTLGAAERASLYNNVAWELAQKDIEVDMCLSLSKEATLWAKAEIAKPTEKQPQLNTESAWKKSRQYNFAMYADTYAFLLMKKKDYSAALVYAKEAATIQEGKNTDYNERYAQALDKVVTPEEVQQILEPMIVSGKVGTEAKAIFKKALITNLKSEVKAEAYLTSLSKSAVEKAKDEMLKKAMNEVAPKFSLKNMDGKLVSLEALKGKVVILDFWATWCGPCKASFPGMQKAVDKYKGNADVVFLFVDTWESQETAELRKKEVTAFIAENKYSFNVLYDEKAKENADAFEVVTKYKVEGIPTKFIIGKDGNIKFKSVGFSGSADALVEEISTMIDMAGK